MSTNAMTASAMPATALIVLLLIVSSIGLVGAFITTIVLLAFYRERKDIQRAKEIAKAKNEMKDRVRRLKEEEASKLALNDAYFNKYKEFIDGL